MKRVILSFTAIALSAVFILSCGTRKPNVAPEPDTELESAIDVAWATFVITDIDAKCGFMGEDAGLAHFYTPIPGTQYTGTNTATQGSMAITRGLADKAINISFNKTACNDGHYRDGTIRMEYGPRPDVFKDPSQVDGNIYTRDYSFGGLVTLLNYKLDGWLISTLNGEPAILRNTVKEPTYDPSVVKLTWTLSGKFRFEHPTDTSKNITWIGTLYKTLTNSTDKKVFKATSTHKTDSAINWVKAIVSYSAVASGYTSRTIPFKLTVGGADNEQMVRDYGCYPDKIAAVATTGSVGVLSQRLETFHPISKGVMSFTTGNQYPRQIYFGNEGNTLPEQCDNVGEVLIKGNTYRINFRK